MKIIHIISYQRSGSTVLGLALGQYNKVSYLGEISAVFTHNWDKMCSCRSHDDTHVSECPLWGPVLDQSKNVLRKYNLWESNTNDGVTKKERSVFLRKALRQLKKKKNGPELAAIYEIIQIILQKTQEVENTEVIVDSSKDLFYMQIVENFFQNEYFPLPLIRDSRGVVYSARKSPTIPGKATPLTLWRSFRVALGWGYKNLLIEKYTRRSVKNVFPLLRYEDWCETPKKITDDLIRKISSNPQNSPFVDNSTLRVSPCHSYFGNRSRENNGTLTIRPDESWRNGLENKFFIPATASSLPFLKKYGYSLER